MHIVIANQWYPPESGWGGVAMYNHTIANAYRKLGHEVTVVARRNDSSTPEYHEIDGIRIHRLLTEDRYRLRRAPVAGRYLRPLQQLSYSRRVHQRLKEIHQSHPIDVVEFADVNAEAYFFSRRPSLPFVVRCHTPTFVLRESVARDELPFDTRIISACEKKTIRRAHALTAPSRDMAVRVAQATGLDAENIAVIPNPLDAATLNGHQTSDDRRPAMDGREMRSPVVLYLGRIEAAKGILMLAEAIPLVLKVTPNARFLIGGYDRPTARGTSQRAEVEEALKRAGAAANVEFLGAVEQADLRSLYERVDLCVSPALQYESFSYTCAQAMAAHKPVVATRTGGVPETVENGVTGLNVEPGDAGGLARAIAHLLNDKQVCRAMGEAGHAKVVREYDPLHIAERNLEIYKQARKALSRRGTE